MNVRTNLFLLFALLLCTTACECGKGKDIPNVSDIPVEVKLKRFEQSLFALDTNNMAAGLEKIAADYPDFAPVFFGQVLGSTDTTIAPEGHLNYVQGFVSHPSVRKLYDTCQVIYPDLKWLEKTTGEQLGDLGVGDEFLLFAAIVYIVAQIFKRGIELKEENELTV